MAAAARRELSLGECDPLDPRQYAEHLGIVILGLEDLNLSTNDRHQLLVQDPSSWSGLTIKEAGFTAVILNQTQSEGRQRNTLMHEIAHVQLRHVPNRVDVAAGGILLVSDFSPEQEDEANWLAGALLLPRIALLRDIRAGRSESQICMDYGVSNELCRWRIRMTGVGVQTGTQRFRSG